MRMLKAVCIAAAVAVSLAGCAGGQIQYERKFGANPPIGQQAVSSPGDIVYTEFDYAAVSGATLKSGYRDTIQLMEIQFPPGAELVQFGSEYCTSAPVVRSPITGQMGNACLSDSNGDGAFDGISGSNLFPASIDPLPYDKVSIGSGSGFRKELLYQGIQGETVRLSYREYANDMARPAFQQDLTYNMERAGPTRVTFKGVQLEISGANNNGLSYRVLTGFSGQ